MPRGGYQHAVAGTLFALLALAYLWPVLLGGDVLSPAAVLYYHAPWERYLPGDVGHYLNQALTDVPAAVYPWRSFARALIHQGTLPAWDPHVLAGTPFLSNPQTGIFSPFSLPLWTLPLDDGIGVGAALKLWAGGAGTYLLVRQLGLRFLPGLLAGVSFAFCSLNVVWLTHETLPAVAVLLPWMLLAVERIFAGGGLGSAVGLAIATAFALGGGHPGMQLHVMLAAVLYLLLRAAFTREAEPPARLRPLLLAGAGLALGALAMAVLLVPELRASHGTIGTLARQGGQGTLPGQQMPFAAVRTVLFPDWWGRPSAVQANDLLVNYNEGTFYAGVVAALLAAVGVAARDRWRRKAPFVLLGAFGLAVTLRAPGLYQLVEQLPGLALVQNQRLHFLFELAVAVLAAYGLQALLERPAGDRVRLAAVLVVVLAGTAAVVQLAPSPAQLAALSGQLLGGAAARGDTALALRSAGWAALLGGATLGALLATRRWPGRRGAIAAGLVLLAAFDMLHFAHGYQPMGPRSRVFPPSTPTVAFLQAHASEGRFTGLQGALPNDWAQVYGLDDIRGYDAPAPTLRYFRLWRAVNPAQTSWQPLSLDDLAPPAIRLMSLLGVRYLVTEPGVDVPQGADPALRAMRRVRADADAQIFGNAMAIPRALVVPRVVLSAGEAQTIATLLEADFDPRRAVVVERSEPGAAALARAPVVHGSARVAGQRNDRVMLRARLDRPGIVLLDDSLTDGWRVAVDGRPARALRVDSVLRGVRVGAGSHRIVWSYRVPGLRLGVALSLVALALTAGMAVAAGVRARRRRGGRRRPARRRGERATSTA